MVVTGRPPPRHGRQQCSVYPQLINCATSWPKQMMTSCVMQKFPVGELIKWGDIYVVYATTLDQVAMRLSDEGVTSAHSLLEQPSALVAVDFHFPSTVRADGSTQLEPAAVLGADPKAYLLTHGSECVRVIGR